MSEFDPDLTLYVTQERVNGRTVLRYIISARDPDLRLYLKPLGQVPLEKDPEGHFQELSHEIAHASRDDLADWVPGRGIQLGELLPEDLRRKLWTWRDKGWTVLIASNEAWIPWELLKLKDPDSRSSSGPFLVEAFSVTRWLYGEQPPRNLPLQRIATVIPQDSQLPKAEHEGKMLQTFDSEEHKVQRVPPVYEDLKKAMDSGLYDGWHFTGHGIPGYGSPYSWGVLLEKERELTTMQLNMLNGEFGQRRPLVFLNACFSGRGARSLVGITGLASSFIEAGAGAFLGSHWKVRDQQAFCFAEQFYKHFFSGMEIADAVRHARLTVRDRFSGHDWLTYTVFAHPLARCILRQKEKKPRVVKKDRRPATASPVVESQSPTPNTWSEPSLPLTRSAGESTHGKRHEEKVHEKTGMVLVYVPGGEFMIGAEDLSASTRPVRRIRLRPFWIGKFPVTNEQYAHFLHENEAVQRPEFWADPRFNQSEYPVVGVSWYEAAAYCRWAGLELPTESQWEVAARATDQRPYPWGKKLPTPQHANYGNQGTSQVGAHPLGEGPYGTQDQLGNVWEWCADPWVVNAYRQMKNGASDPIAEGDGTVRSMRGGSWVTPAQDLHAACREGKSSKLRFKFQGFRCVLVLD